MAADEDTALEAATDTGSPMPEDLFRFGQAETDEAMDDPDAGDSVEHPIEFKESTPMLSRSPSPDHQPTPGPSTQSTMQTRAQLKANVAAKPKPVAPAASILPSFSLPQIEDKNSWVEYRKVKNPFE